MKAFSFSTTVLEPESLRVALEDPTAGGYVSFEGWVRNHNEGHAVTRLEYEAFEALANKEGERIVNEALQRFGVVKAACVHRVGSLDIGDLAVWVGVSSRHRAEAFAACRYIIDEVKHRVPIWKKEHYVTGDSGWVNCERCAAHGHEHAEHAGHGQALAGHGLRAMGDGQNQHDHHAYYGHHHHDDDGAHAHGVQPPTVARRPSPVTPTSPVAPAAPARPDYSRQISLPAVGTAGQAKLSAARVLVVGAGGLGVPVLSYLAGAGVGTLGIVDGDTLDASNLHRQTMYAFADVGQPKASLAARHLRALNPEVNVRVHLERFTSSNAQGLVTDYDLVVECSDNFATKFLVNDAAVNARKPAVFASVYQYEGQLQVYGAQPDSACLRCLWPEATRDGIVGNCAEAGVLGPVPGVLGCLQALEALKLLLGMQGVEGELVLIDLLTLEQRKLRMARRTDCNHDQRTLVSSNPSSVEVVFNDLDAAWAAGFSLVDVREPQEVRDAPIAGGQAIHIPLAKLLASPDGLSRDQRYLVVCARGSRSRAATEHLREQGFAHAYSLRGGIAALGT